MERELRYHVVATVEGTDRRFKAVDFESAIRVVGQLERYFPGSGAVIRAVEKVRR